MPNTVTGRCASFSARSIRQLRKVIPFGRC
jgi:hypothetical protein